MGKPEALVLRKTKMFIYRIAQKYPRKYFLATCSTQEGGRDY